MTKKKRVAIIGAGIFGITIGTELAHDLDVDIFDKSNTILSGATYANHNRHHYGFHYPRSDLTVEQCSTSRFSFEKKFGKTLFKKFSNYYAVAKINSLINFDDYILFLKRNDLKFKEVITPSIFNKKLIDGCVLVDEPIYDYDLLLKCIQRNINDLKNNINIYLNHEVTKIDVSNNKKKLTIINKSNEIVKKYDFVIDCSYGQTNKIRQLLNQNSKDLQFNLQELSIIKIKKHDKFGATIVDGMFPSILPIGHTDYYLFAHAEESILKREVNKSFKSILSNQIYIETNWKKIFEQSVQFLPILKNAEYIKSIITDRIVDHNNKKNDDRVSEITYLGNGCWSIFSAKVITCVYIAKQLKELIKNQL